MLESNRGCLLGEPGVLINALAEPSMTSSSLYTTYFPTSYFPFPHEFPTSYFPTSYFGLMHYVLFLFLFCYADLRMIDIQSSNHPRRFATSCGAKQIPASKYTYRSCSPVHRDHSATQLHQEDFVDSGDSESFQDDSALSM